MRRWENSIVANAGTVPAEVLEEGIKELQKLVKAAKKQGRSITVNAFERESNAGRPTKGMLWKLGPNQSDDAF
jgi:hypothetical protein